MGLSVAAYGLLAGTGIGLYYFRRQKSPRPQWLRPFHYTMGIVFVTLVLLLLTIGIIGTIGQYGNLGHSPHLIAGLVVVTLTLVSAGSASQISPKRQWARRLHVTTNAILLFALAYVSWTGWDVVQQYLD